MISKDQGTLQQKKQSAFWPIVQVASGNFLEMYDFMVFGYYAAAIGRTFFPSGSAFRSLMLSLTTFAAGFLMRPLGAVVLGSYTDQHGRRKGLILTLLLMSVGTLSVACAPSYSSIGLLAPLIVLLGRLLEGFSAGAELGGVSVYLAEIATPRHKGFFVSWQSGSQQLAVIVAAVTGVAVTANLSHEQMAAFGWRIPLLIGCAIIPFLFLLRRHLQETEQFAARKRTLKGREVLRTLGRHWKIVANGLLLVVMTTVSFYLITAYTPTFGSSVLHLDSTQTLLVTLCVGISNLIWLPLMGALSDRVGRRPILIVFTLLTLITAYPALLYVVHAPSFGRLLQVELWFSFLYGSYNGAMVVFLTEMMPEEVRTSGFSLAYSLATALFGGSTPVICTWLIHATANRAMPGIWLSIAAVCGLVAAIWTPARNESAQPAL